MNAYRATPKQRSYFTSLTGDSLPFKTTKAQASKLIEKALAGKYVKKMPHIRVAGYTFDIRGEETEVKYQVMADWRPVESGFDTIECAQKWAEGQYPGAEIEVDRHSVARYIADV